MSTSEEQIAQLTAALAGYVAKENAEAAAAKAAEVDINLIKPGMSGEDWTKVAGAIKKVLHEHDVRSGRFS
jgi:hypothetical protein